MANVADYLIEIHTSGVKELTLSKEEFEILERWMAYNGQWNWNRRTWWDITLIVK